jgi:hypothetical protein
LACFYLLAIKAAKAESRSAASASNHGPSSAINTNGGGCPLWVKKQTFAVLGATSRQNGATSSGGNMDDPCGAKCPQLPKML